MTEQPDETQADGDEALAPGEGTAFNASVKTENNTGGFKPGRDDVEDED